MAEEELVRGTFKFTAYDGKESEPIPYNASISEMARLARKVGIMIDEKNEDPNVDLTIGGLRTRAMNARSAIVNNTRDGQMAAEANTEFVKAMALLQIAQDLNEIKHLLGFTAASGDQ